MIFVTVGTHEQPFNRLIEEVDRLKGEGLITEEVIIQRGYSTYEPKHCKYYDLIPWEEMQRYNKEARIIITHGGPASFIDVLSLGKKPIIVPRQEKYGEHVNDHQILFSKQLIERGMPIILIDDIKDLSREIINYNELSCNKFDSNNDKFNECLIDYVKKLF